MVCSSAMSFNCFWLQILLCSCVNETTLFSFLRSLLGENGRSPPFPKIFLQKQTQWSNDKTIIWRLSQNIVIRHYVADLLATDKSRYFAQPCPIIANYSYFWKNIGPVGYNLRPRAIHATSCVWSRGCIKENFKRSKKLLNMNLLLI